MPEASEARFANGKQRDVPLIAGTNADEGTMRRLGTWRGLLERRRQSTSTADTAVAMVTRTLLFVGEGPGMYAEPKGSGGRMLRAYDKASGEVVAEIELPYNQTSVPMSYEHEGRQYILLAVGARRVAGEFVALALPD